MKAKNFCRNPNSDTGGPWCYVEGKSYELVEKEYCDIPFCDNEGKIFQSKNQSFTIDKNESCKLNMKNMYRMFY